MCDCKRDRLWVRLPLQEMRYLIYPFLRSSVKAKRGVEFRHLTPNTFTILPLPILLMAKYSVKLEKKYINSISHSIKKLQIALVSSQYSVCARTFQTVYPVHRGCLELVSSNLVVSSPMCYLQGHYPPCTGLIRLLYSLNPA